MNDLGDLEQIALSTLTAAGYDEPPVDALDLAECCGLTVQWRRGAACMMGRTVYLDPTARVERQHGGAAHELAHALLQDHAMQDDEPSARYLAGCLMVPRAALRRALAGGADLVALRACHVHASHEVIARRIAEVRDAVVTILDHGRVRARVASPWLGPAPSMSEVEARAADAALTDGRVHRVGDTHAVPVIDRHWRRVVVVSLV
jgi:hypothetical protein